MKLHPCLALLDSLLLSCHPDLWAAPTDQDVTAIEPPFSDPDSHTEFNRLTTKAIDEGSIQVMVVLKEDINTVGFPHSQEQLDAQQTQIENQQNSLMTDVPIRLTNSIKRFRHLPFLVLSADESELQRLRASPHVAQILRDKVNYPASLDFNIKQIGADVAQSLGYTGAGQTIAILDNGVDKRQPFLRNKVVAEACFSTRNPGQKATPACRNRRTEDLRPGAATVKCKFQDFECTHGTIIAEIAAGNSLTTDFAGSGVAPEANLITIKADSLITNRKICAPASSCHVFFDSDILRGLDFVYSKRFSLNIASINASLGGDATRQECKTSPIRRTVAKLRAANIVTIAASGNEGYKNRLSSPACIPGVISVGATNAADAVLPFSNSASSLSLLAPGENIRLPMPGVVSAGFEIVASGTSLSAAFVSGAWATLKAHKPSATVNEILEALKSSGIRVYDPKNGLVRPLIQVNQAHAAIIP